MDLLKQLFQFVMSLRTLTPMIIYCTTGLFRKRFDPHSSGDIYFNLNAYDKKTVPHEYFGYSFTGVSNFIGAYINRLWRLHRIEITIVVIFVTLLDFYLLYPAQPSQRKESVCDFMISFSLLKQMRQIYNNTLASSASTRQYHETIFDQECKLKYSETINYNKLHHCHYSIPIKLNVSEHIYTVRNVEYEDFKANHEGVCNFLHLFEVLRCIGYLIFMSLWHIYRDCQEHRVISLTFTLCLLNLYFFLFHAYLFSPSNLNTVYLYYMCKLLIFYHCL